MLRHVVYASLLHFGVETARVKKLVGKFPFKPGKISLTLLA
jgi:hypothetical protein